MAGTVKAAAWVTAVFEVLLDPLAAATRSERGKGCGTVRMRRINSPSMTRAPRPCMSRRESARSTLERIPQASTLCFPVSRPVSGQIHWHRICWDCSSGRLASVWLPKNSPASFCRMLAKTRRASLLQRPVYRATSCTKYRGRLVLNA